MSKLFAAQLGALSKFAYGAPASLAALAIPLSLSLSDRHLGQMMNCKLDVAQSVRVRGRRRYKTHTCACDESCPKHATLYWQRLLPLPSLSHSRSRRCHSLLRLKQA